MESDQEHINSVERQPQHPLASCFRACYSWQLHSSAYVKILSRAHSIFSEMWHDNIPKGKGFGGEHPSIFTCWTPRGKTFCVMSIFFPSNNRTGRLRERQHCCVSSSPGFLPLIPPSFSPRCRQRGRGQKRLLLLFWREIMSKINNLYRFNPNVSHKTIFQSLDV